MARRKEDMPGLLKAKGWSVAELIESANLSRQTVYNLLDGSRDSKMGTLWEVASALGVGKARVEAAFRTTRENAGH